MKRKAVEVRVSCDKCNRLFGEKEVHAFKGIVNYQTAFLEAHEEPADVSLCPRCAQRYARDADACTTCDKLMLDPGVLDLCRDCLDEEMITGKLKASGDLEKVRARYEEEYGEEPEEVLPYEFFINDGEEPPKDVMEMVERALPFDPEELSYNSCSSDDSESESSGED